MARAAGYSGTPLPKKLGIAADSRLVLLAAPAGFDATLGDLPRGVTITTRIGAAEVTVLFVTRRAELERRLPTVRRRMPPAGAFWIAWPKRASGVSTDVTEDVVRAVALPTGLVDNKVCAIDETWSGLRLVIRVALRERR